MTQARPVRACGNAHSVRGGSSTRPARGCDSGVRAWMALRAWKPVCSAQFCRRYRRAAVLTGGRVCGTGWLSVM